MEKKAQSSVYKEALFSPVTDKLAVIRAQISKCRKAKSKQTATK